MSERPVVGGHRVTAAFRDSRVPRDSGLRAMTRCRRPNERCGGALARSAIGLEERRVAGRTAMKAAALCVVSGRCQENRLAAVIEARTLSAFFVRAFLTMRKYRHRPQAGFVSFQQQGVGKGACFPALRGLVIA